jgi:hypothetical protein
VGATELAEEAAEAALAGERPERRRRGGRQARGPAGQPEARCHPAGGPDGAPEAPAEDGDDPEAQRVELCPQREPGRRRGRQDGRVLVHAAPQCKPATGSRECSEVTA